MPGARRFPTDKYQADGGPGLEDMARVLELVMIDDPGASIVGLARGLMFNCRHWERLGTAVGLDGERLVGEVGEMARRLPDEMAAVIAGDELSGDDARFRRPCSTGSRSGAGTAPAPWQPERSS